MTLSLKIKASRLAAQMSLDRLADLAGISKTYLWELEADHAGAKKPSADVLSRLATALGLSLPELIGQPTAGEPGRAIAIPPALAGFRARMESLGEPLSDADAIDLASIRFRGGQPRSVDGWHDLYRILIRP